MLFLQERNMNVHFGFYNNTLSTILVYHLESLTKLWIVHVSFRN